MRDFFNMDNGFFRALGRLADMMMLNIAFLVCSIPIFTIGASLTGMYYVTLKMAENEEGYIIRGFLKSFRQNFKQATVIWLLTLVFGAVLILDIMILRDSQGTVATVMRVAIIAVGVIYLMVFCYVFPVLARFFNTIRGTIKNSLLMAIASLPYTVVILVITIVPVVMTFYNGYTLWYGLLLWMLFGFAAIAYANSHFLKKVFAKFTPESAAQTADPDKWEVEEAAGQEPEPGQPVAQTLPADDKPKLEKPE